MPKNSAKRSAGAFGSNHLLHILNASEDHRISRVGALKALGVPKTRATLDRLSDVINVLEADSRLEKIGGHSICLPCAPKCSRGAPTKFQSNFLEALEQAETQQLSRVGALKAMGLRRTRGNMDRLARAIDALHLEGSVQKLGGHSVCLLSGDAAAGTKRKNNDMEDSSDEDENWNDKDEKDEKSKRHKNSRTDENDKNSYLELIQEESGENGIALNRVRDFKLEKEGLLIFGDPKGVTEKWMVETMSPHQLKLLQIEGGNDFGNLHDIYRTVINEGMKIANQDLKNAIDTVVEQEREIARLLTKNDHDDDEDGIEKLSEIDRKRVQIAKEKIKAQWEKIDEESTNLVENVQPLEQKNKHRAEMLRTAKILKLTMPQKNIKTLTFPAHKLVKIPHLTDDKIDTFFRFSPPTDPGSRPSVGEREVLLSVDQEVRPQQIVVKKLTRVPPPPPEDGEFFDEEEKYEWKPVDRHVPRNAYAASAKKNPPPQFKSFSFPTELGKCSVYCNSKYETVIHVEMQKAPVYLSPGEPEVMAMLA